MPNARGNGALRRLGQAWAWWLRGLSNRSEAGREERSGGFAQDAVASLQWQVLIAIWPVLYQVDGFGQSCGVFNRPLSLPAGQKTSMTATTDGAKSAARASKRHSIRQLPINLFASVMGVTGLALAWREAAGALAIPAWPGEAFGWMGLAIFVALALSYVIKLVRHPEAVHAEFTHPVMGNFFGTISIGLLLLSAFLFHYNEALGEGVWILGTVLTIGIGYIVVQKFLTSPQKGETTLPPLILPGVATLDVPVNGLGHAVRVGA